MEHSIRRLLRTKKICRSQRVLSASSLRLWRIAPSSICIILHIILSLVQQLLIKREKPYDYLLILNLNVENFTLEKFRKIFLKASHFFSCEKTFFKFQNDFTWCHFIRKFPIVFQSINPELRRVICTGHFLHWWYT